MAEIHGLIAGIFRIMHPELYHSACDAMAKIRRSGKFTDIVDRWGSPFNALTLIVNRHCGPHRDTKSSKTYLDLLASFGDFDTVRFKLNSINAEVNIKSGGVVGICGHVLRHEALRCAGNRICCAWYMRESVHASMEVQPVGWMNQQIYSDFIPDPEKRLKRKWIQRRL